VNCDRAFAILRGLETKQLEAQGDELDELIGPGLVIEADPRDLAELPRIESLVAEYPEFFGEGVDPLSPEGMREALADVDKKLKDDWYRLRISAASLREQEGNRVALRRALGLVSDREAGPRLRKTASERTLVAQGAMYLPCPAVGSGVFAITHKGRRVLGELSVRIARFAGTTLRAFLAQLEKADAKMAAFSQQVEALSNHVGYVRKGKANVVIGLVKSDLPAQQVAGLYAQALSQSRAPDVAVVCTRNAAREGGAAQVVHKLGAAYQALLRAGFTPAPIVEGAAKSLLPWNPPDAGVPRYLELFQRLQRAGGAGDNLHKFASRLMPAAGSPAELVHRSLRAGHVLSQAPMPVVRRQPGLSRASVALASMVRDDASVDGLCVRFIEVERALTAARLCLAEVSEAHALECVSSAGTPAEVVAVVGALAARLSGGRQITDEHLTIAAAFAKRFAY
jgi:hypothetical protein